MRKTRILELNNIDTIGRRFNGYDIANFFAHSKLFDIKMLVNHRLGKSSIAKKLFKPNALEEYDYIIEYNEKEFLSVKNQMSITGASLARSKYYKRANILHFHQYHNMNLPIEFLNTINPNKKIILELHDTFWLTDDKIPMLEVFNFTNKNSDSLNAQRKRILENIDAEFVVHSPYMLNLFRTSETTKNLKNVHLINFGIDTKKFKPLDNKILRKKYDIKPDEIVLFFRAQKEFKGLDYIIKALKLLKTNKKITLITVSNKGLLNSLPNKYKIIEFGLINSEKKLAELYNICDIFLSPSTEESFGFMAAEAMACGKPVIVFDGTALPHTTNAPEIGLSSKRDAKLLCDNIKYLIENEAERIKRGEKGIQFVNRNYNLENYFKSYEKLFKKLSNKPKRKINCNNHDDSNIESIPPTFLKTLDRITNNTLKASKPKISPEQEPLIINYNDSNIQKALKIANSNLYKKLNKKTIIIISRKLRRHIIPAPIRKIAIKIRSKK